MKFKFIRNYEENFFTQNVEKNVFSMFECWNECACLNESDKTELRNNVIWLKKANKKKYDLIKSLSKCHWPFNNILIENER